MKKRLLYLYSGRVSHILQPQDKLNDFPYTPALCGRAPEFGLYWYGEGSQDEYDEAERRPVCKRCLAHVDLVRRRLKKYREKFPDLVIKSSYDDD